MPVPAAAQRFHPLLVRAVVQALITIFQEGRYADKVIEQILRQNPKAGSRDRAFIAETIYEIVRYFRLYSEILGATPVSEADFWKICGIHLIVSQRNPNPDPVNPTPAPPPEEEGRRDARPSTSPLPFRGGVGGGAGGLGAGGARREALPFGLTRTPHQEETESMERIALPDWQEFKDLNIKSILEKHAALSRECRFRESIPDWLDQLGAIELGDCWEETMHQLNQPAQVVLRTNGLKTTRAELQQMLHKEGIETQLAGDGDALVLERRQNVFQTKAFKDGLFEVQDFSSQLVAPLLAPEPGMRVVDACAGGGGKTLHLAALMQGRGQLIALDTLAWKLDELRLRARRAGASNIETRPIDNRKVVKRLYNSADRLLLDVPCSGLGVLRRNPDSKWKLSPEFIDKLRETQQDILQFYCPIVKPGGRMLYATCSILPSENEQQVRIFLNSEAGKAFHLLEEKKILPQDNGFDGFYMALLARNE